jgi:hypothetical protein
LTHIIIVPYGIISGGKSIHQVDIRSSLDPALRGDDVLMVDHGYLIFLTYKTSLHILNPKKGKFYLIYINL